MIYDIYVHYRDAEQVHIQLDTALHDYYGDYWSINLVLHRNNGFFSLGEWAYHCARSDGHIAHSTDENAAGNAVRGVSDSPRPHVGEHERPPDWAEQLLHRLLDDMERLATSSSDTRIKRWA